MIDTDTTFHQAIAAIPYEPRETNATGIVAAIMRATGHILYLVGALAEPGYTLTEDEVQRELTDATAHLASTVAATSHAPCSTAIRQQIGAFVLAVALARNDYESNWTAEQRGPNLRALADAATALGARLDRELFGLANSDPGRSL